jgi:glycosyltransferase involved in cell wall biosynthesis
MKTAICTIAYNEAEWIRACIRQFKPFNMHHLVLVSTKPWNGVPQPDDRTADIAREEGAEVIVGYWKDEAEQRNYGLALLRDYDRVLIVDADELYESSSIQALIDCNTSCPAIRTDKMWTYWKTPEYRFDPPDRHEPIVAVDPKRVLFSEHRQIRQFLDYVPEFNQELLSVPMHHMSWAKSVAKIAEKIESFSHAADVKPGWYEDVWLKWTPDMEDIRPYGKELSKAIYAPAPAEIHSLFL